MLEPRAETWSRRLARCGVPARSAQRLVDEWEDHRRALTAELREAGLRGLALAEAVRARLGSPRALLEAARGAAQRRGVLARHPLLAVASAPLFAGAALLLLGLVSIALARAATWLGAPLSGSVGAALVWGLATLTAEAPWPLLGWLGARWALLHGVRRRTEVAAGLLLSLTGAMAWVAYELPRPDAAGTVSLGLAPLAAPWRLASPWLGWLLATGLAARSRRHAST